MNAWNYRCKEILEGYRQSKLLFYWMPIGKYHSQSSVWTKGLEWSAVTEYKTNSMPMGKPLKASTVFHLELVPEVFQSCPQYSWLCVHIRNPKHQNSSTKMMIEVHAFWNFSPSHRQQHSSPSTFTGLHNKTGHKQAAWVLIPNELKVQNIAFTFPPVFNFIFNLFHSYLCKIN